MHQLLIRGRPGSELCFPRMIWASHVNKAKKKNQAKYFGGKKKAEPNRLEKHRPWQPRSWKAASAGLPKWLQLTSYCDWNISPPSAASTSSPSHCIIYMNCKYLRDCCSVVFWLCPGQHGPGAFGQSWCSSWPQEGLVFHGLILHEPRAAYLGPGTVLALCVGCVNWLKLALGTGNSVNFSFPFYPMQCPRRTTVSLVWIFLYWYADRRNMLLSKFLCRGIIWGILRLLSPLSYIIWMDVVYRGYCWKSMLVCCYWEVLAALLASIPMAEQSGYPVIDGKCGYNGRNNDIPSIYLQGRRLTFQNKYHRGKI